MKRHQIRMPLQRLTHWILYHAKIYLYFRNPILCRKKSRVTAAAIFCAVPKTGSMSVHKALTEILVSFFDGGGFLYAPDLKTLARAQAYANKHARNPAVIGVGHQHAIVLVKCGLMSIEELSQTPVLMIERNDRERFASAMRYGQSGRLLPVNYDEQRVLRRIAKHGAPDPQSFDTSIRWGVPIHFSPSHLWREGLPSVIGFSLGQLVDCINHVLQLSGYNQKLERAPHVNRSE